VKPGTVLEWRVCPRSNARLHQLGLALTISVRNVQKFSRVSSRTGPAAQTLRQCLFLGLCLIACNSANVKSPAVIPTAEPRNDPKISVSEQAHWDFFDVAGTRTPVVVPLPKAGSWQIDDQRSPWWVASNATLEMKLEARLWSERRRVTTDECLADLRRWRREPGRDQWAKPVESRVERVPEGFDSRLLVALGRVGPESTGAATILLVGADISRCFAFMASVEPTRALSQSELLARVALVTEAILPKIRLRAIEQRVVVQSR
jgi:hypothetical protein